MSGLMVQNRAQAGRTLRIGNKDVAFDAEGIARDVPPDCEMFAPDGRSKVRGFQLLEGVPVTPADQEMQDAGGMAHIYCPPHFAGKTLSCTGGDVAFDENGYAYAPANYFKGVRGFRVELDEPKPEIQVASSLADLPDLDGSVSLDPNKAADWERMAEVKRRQAEEFDAVSAGFRARAASVFQPPTPETDGGEGTDVEEFEETVFQPPTGDVPPTDQTFLPMAPSGNLAPSASEPEKTPKPQSRRRSR